MKNKLRKKIAKKWKELGRGYETHLTFADSLKAILELVDLKKPIRVEEIFSILAGRGYPALLILLALPFCLPIQIPGFSAPFGVVLMFIGLRIAFGRKPWWPQWLLKKEVSGEVVEKIVTKTLNIFLKVQKVLRPRFSFLLWDISRHFHGFMIFIFAFILSLPLVLPFTNFFAALPIVCFGVGLLEDDGLVILLGYVIGLFSFAYYLSLLWFGNQILTYF